MRNICVIFQFAEVEKNGDFSLEEEIRKRNQFKKLENQFIDIEPLQTIFIVCDVIEFSSEWTNH